MKKIALQHLAGLVYIGAIFLVIFAFLPGVPISNSRSMDRLAVASHVSPPFFGMYVRFIFVFLAVMFLAYYGAQTLALYRYVRYRQNMSAPFDRRDRIVAGGMWTFLSFLLFAPGYVIVYALKSVIDTSSVFVMIVLGVVSNGVLANYAHKFYTLLLHEGRKGYVQTAFVKNVRTDFTWNTPEGLRLQWLLGWRKHFPGHVLDNIFRNACHQYKATLKEQASFVITGLVIIEMALNIQGHLCYELLQDILFKQYGAVLGIMFSIFCIVKMTDVIVDAWIWRGEQRLSNADEGAA
jgi:hypothetical protein